MKQGEEIKKAIGKLTLSTYHLRAHLDVLGMQFEKVRIAASKLNDSFKKL